MAIEVGGRPEPGSGADSCLPRFASLPRDHVEKSKVAHVLRNTLLKWSSASKLLRDMPAGLLQKPCVVERSDQLRGRHGRVNARGTRVGMAHQLGDHRLRYATQRQGDPVGMA